MSWPAFYYYSEPGAPLTYLDLGRPISDVFMVPTRSRVDAIGGDGGCYHQLNGGGARVTIRRERLSDATTERSLRNMEDHLMRGGRVAFSWDHAKTWAGYGTGGLTRGDALCRTLGNAFTSWSSAGALAVGDEVVIESPNPEMKREINTVSAITSGQITLGTAAAFTYVQRHFVRYRHFYPALYMPESELGRSILTGDRNLNWALDLRLAIDPRILAVSLHTDTPTGDLLADVSDIIGHQKWTLEDLVASARASSSPSASYASTYRDSLFGRR